MTQRKHRARGHQIEQSIDRAAGLESLDPRAVETVDPDEQHARRLGHVERRQRLRRSDRTLGEPQDGEREHRRGHHDEQRAQRALAPAGDLARPAEDAGERDQPGQPGDENNHGDAESEERDLGRDALIRTLGTAEQHQVGQRRQARQQRRPGDLPAANAEPVAET